MSISKINHNFLNKQILKNSPSQSFINFKATGNNNTDHNMSDESLYTLSELNPNKRLSQVCTNATKTFLITIPLVNCVLNGFVAKGNLSQKIGKSLNTAGKWAGALATTVLVSAAKNYVNSKSEKLSEFDKKHNIISTLVDFVVILTAYRHLDKTAKTLVTYTKNSFPNIINKVKNNIFNPVKEYSNNSFINKKIVKPFDNYLKKNMYSKITANMVADLALPAMMLSTISRLNKEIKIHNKTINENFDTFKEINNLIEKQKENNNCLTE